jgi:hypothetical protein
LPVTVCCAQPVAWPPAVTDTMGMLWPDGVGTTAWKLPSEPATVWTITVVLPLVPGWLAAMWTVAPGVVFPLPVAWACWMVRPGSWLARMSSVIPGASVDVLGGVATAPGAPLCSALSTDPEPVKTPEGKAGLQPRRTPT